MATKLLNEQQTRDVGAAREPVLVDLALRGGGAQGAFTGGVLDRLMDEPWLRIDGISGTSAGAMNAVVLAGGFAADGPAGAKAALHAFWRRVADSARFSPIRRSPLDVVLGRWTLDTSPFYLAFDLASRVFSPYDMKFAGANPLHKVLAESVDFAQVARAPIRLFVTATNVHTGRGRVFRNAELTPDVLLASACLPTLFRAVEIDGVPYWDGGYMGNPAIFPFFGATETEDVLVVQINPRVRKVPPKSSQEILNRLNEITFNSSLLAEFRAIDFVRRLIDQKRLPRGTGPGQYRRVNVHRIALDEAFRKLTAASKLSSDYDFFVMLRNGGRRAARNFLAAHFDDLGRDATIDLRAEAQAEWA